MLHHSFNVGIHTQNLCWNKYTLSMHLSAITITYFFWITNAWAHCARSTSFSAAATTNGSFCKLTLFSQRYVPSIPLDEVVYLDLWRGIVQSGHLVLGSRAPLEVLGAAHVRSVATIRGPLLCYYFLVSFKLDITIPKGTAHCRVQAAWCLNSRHRSWLCIEPLEFVQETCRY